MKRVIAFLLFLLFAAPLRSEESFTQNLNQTGLFTYYLLDKSSNTIISPLSINSALLMCYVGAKGETAKEIQNALRISEDQQGALEASEALLSRIGSGMKIANSMWVDQSISILPSYNQIVANGFNGIIKKVTFKNKAQTAAAMNNWIYDHSGDKISKFIDPSTLTQGEKMVLLNTLFLQGTWKHLFPTQRTGMLPFHAMDGSSPLCPMMNQTALFPYYEDGDTQVIALPIEGLDANVAFLVFFPKKKQSALYNFYYAQDESKPEGFLSYLRKLEDKEVNLTLPKFIVGQKLDLKSIFHSLGVSAALGPAADFSGITGKKNLFISQASHASLLSITEEGIFASASSGISFNLKSTRKPKAIEMDVNRPFLYAVYDFDANLLLFIGECINPTETSSLTKEAKENA
ncbi:MAG: serpin family protein [Chlamydiia bacterium]|nr:serpin family protein [Chlamydiia bacterium]